MIAASNGIKDARVDEVLALVGLTEVAKRLKIGRSTLYRKMQQHSVAARR